MKPQALAHNTTIIYYHTCWQCVSSSEVRGDHTGNEPDICLHDVGYVPWAQAFFSEEEAKEDLRRTSKCKESETR
jgi:hypothetical protein